MKFTQAITQQHTLIKTDEDEVFVLDKGQWYYKNGGYTDLVELPTLVKELNDAYSDYIRKVFN